MLTRLYIDNFRSFVNFEHKPANRQLLLGANGSGKSSFLDAMFFLRQFVMMGDILNGPSILSQRTRWLNKPEQTWELDAALDDSQVYVYRLVIEPEGEPERPRVKSETLHLNGKPIFRFIAGEVQLFNDCFEQLVSYPFDWHRSALATITPRKDNVELSRFKQWLGGMYCFRLNPFAMSARTDGESLYPNVDLSNIAAWYRNLLQTDPRQNAALLDSLRASLDGFNILKLDHAGETVRLLAAEFEHSKFYFNELSDGQRCLICLYTILHFVLAKGGTVVLDEPDNFISLREIQPWLMAATDAIEDGTGQLLLISHHPEIINQWAPNNGVQFVRDGAGPVRLEEFRGDHHGGISPAEIVARGWERG